MKLPKIVERDCQGYPTVLVPFSDYELANLAAVLAAIFPDRVGIDKKSKISSCFNTGDWVALTEEFARICAKYCYSSSNATPEEYIDRVNNT